MHVSDHGSLLRARDEGEQPVTPFELFFDLVFVFAVTQLSHRLLDDLTVVSVLETLLLFLVVWSAWVTTTWVTNWFNPNQLWVRVMLVSVMLASGRTPKHLLGPPWTTRSAGQRWTVNASLSTA